jgi:hypothetical protein
MGAVPAPLFGHDIFFLLDNGWRVISGQRPHLDYSPWGPVTFLITAAGLTISNHSVNGIGYGNALVALLVGGRTFYVAKNRLTLPPPHVISESELLFGGRRSCGNSLSVPFGGLRSGVSPACVWEVSSRHSACWRIFDVLAELRDLRMAAGARGQSLDPRTPVFNFLNHC